MTEVAKSENSGTSLGTRAKERPKSSKLLPGDITSSPPGQSPQELSRTLDDAATYTDKQGDGFGIGTDPTPRLYQKSDLHACLR